MIFGIPAAVFALTFVFRWLTYPSLSGDDHWSLWTATTFLKGGVPFRDFVDLGAPLFWGVSALAQWVVGYRVIGEVVLGTGLIAFGVALAFHLAWQASRSLWVTAILMVLALLLVSPASLYGYPKIFLYPLGVWLCWRYIDTPSRARVIVLALGVAIAWGYRHDHGAYVGLGAAAAMLAAHWPEGPRRVLVAWARFGIVLLVLLAPYLILIQANEGILQYFRARIEIARRVEAGARQFVRFSVDPDAPSRLYRIDPPPPARVQVDWTGEVTSDTRIALERKYSLTSGVDPATRLNPPPGRDWWEYALTDVTRENIRAIVEDPRVDDTGLIDRNSYRSLEESWWIGVQRAIPLFRLSSIAPRYWHELNAGVWLYYISMALPFLVLITLALDRLRGTERSGMPHASAKMFAAAVMMAVANAALLRRLGYFTDHVDVAAILGAYVIGHAMAAPRRRSATAILTVMATGLVLLVSVLATLTYVPLLSRIGRSIDVSSPGWTARLNNDLRGLWGDGARSFRQHATSPPIDAYAPPGVTGDRGLLRYLYECTRPDDRIWSLVDTFTVPYYTERPVVGHVYWMSGFLATPEFERRTIERVDTEQVPFVVSFGGRRPLEFLEEYPLVHDYVSRRYTALDAIPEDNEQRRLSIWLLTDNRRQPTGTYQLMAGPTSALTQVSLPCFR